MQFCTQRRGPSLYCNHVIDSALLYIPFMRRFLWFTASSRT